MGTFAHAAVSVERDATRYFGTSDRFWLNLQTPYDLEAERDKLGSALVVVGRDPSPPQRPDSAPTG